MYAFVTYDERFIGYNALLTGSLADIDGWRKDKTIDAKHMFAEMAYGIALGYRKFGFS